MRALGPPLATLASAPNLYTLATLRPFMYIEFLHYKLIAGAPLRRRGRSPWSAGQFCQVHRAASV